MAAVGVVNFDGVAGSESGHKGVLQQVENSDKREIIIVRKNPKILPTPTEITQTDILLTNNSRKKAKSRDTPRSHNPPPVAVARRNARERNRVKQVNNGFATLRQHIPTTIAAAFESGNGRGANKKLSKVETLRMAVEYIRSLEELLNSDDCDSNGNTSSGSSVSSFPSPTPSSPTLVPQTTMTYTYQLTPDDQSSDFVQYSTLPDAKYIVSSDFYEDEENMHSLSSNLPNIKEEFIKEEFIKQEFLSHPSLMETDLEFETAHDLSLLNSIQTTASLSPEVYSENSLSPTTTEHNEPETFISVFDSAQQLTERKHLTINGGVQVVEDSCVRVSPVLVCTPSPLGSIEHKNIKADGSGDHQNGIMQTIGWWEEERS